MNRLDIPSLHIHPNPVTRDLYFKVSFYNPSRENVELRLINPQGVEVRLQIIKNRTIIVSTWSLEGLQNGTYDLYIQSTVYHAQRKVIINRR